MKFLFKYSMPIAAALLLAVFFLALPNLHDCRLAGGSQRSRRLTRVDALIMAALSLVYAAVAFYRLGNTESPQSFVDLENSSAVITLPDTQTDTLLLFTGVGIGDYTIDYAGDGENYRALATFHQSHADVLKWHTVTLEEKLTGGSVRISGAGNVWLGEAVFVDAQGAPLAVTCSEPALCDEQELYVLDSTFLDSSYFDEIYHARTAWEHLNAVYPYEITHPPLGKIIISLGISLFGMTPFGWRFSGTLFGVLMLPVMYVFLKKLFGGKAVPAAGTIVFMTDFMHFVQTRISTIDVYAVFFILLMYLFMYLFVTEGRRRDLALSGLFFGLGAACKWTCFYAGAGLAVIWALWVIVHAKDGTLDFAGFLKNAAFCVVFFVAVPLLIYTLSYYPYALARGNTPLFSRDYFRMVWDNQLYMFDYHSSVDATHPYSSRWYQWMLNIRPILYYLKYYPDGTRSSFGAFLNPALCWGGLVSLFALGYTAVARRDKRAAFILIGYFAQLLPWVFVTRVTFEYHYFACSVFLVLAVSHLFDILRRNISHWKPFVFGFAGLSTVLFILFYPALSGKPVENNLATTLLGWLPTWPF